MVRLGPSFPLERAISSLSSRYLLGYPGRYEPIDEDHKGKSGHNGVLRNVSAADRDRVDASLPSLLEAEQAGPSHKLHASSRV
jgi:DNA helicase HerA-like ATPase